LKQGEYFGRPEYRALSHETGRKCKMKKEVISRIAAAIAMLLVMALVTVWFVQNGSLP
jgi:hypothetical protein